MKAFGQLSYREIRSRGRLPGWDFVPFRELQEPVPRECQRPPGRKAVGQLAEAVAKAQDRRLALENPQWQRPTQPVPLGRDSWLDRPQREDQPQDRTQEARHESEQARRGETSHDDHSEDDPADGHEPSKEATPRTLLRPEYSRREAQPAPCRHNQPDAVGAPQNARGRGAQVIFQLLQEPERPADVPCWRVCEMTSHHAGNLGQIALFDKALCEVGWGNLPSD